MEGVLQIRQAKSLVSNQSSFFLKHFLFITEFVPVGHVQVPRSMVFVPIMHDASSMSRYMKNWKNCNELLNDLMVLAVFDSQNIRTGENGDHLISQHNSGAYSFPGLLWPPCLTCSCGYRFSKEVKQVDRNTYKQNTLLF